MSASAVDDDAWSVLPPARRALLESLVAEHVAAHPTGRTVIGFDGPEGGGKKQLADHLALALRRAGREALRTEMDAFHTPAAVRDATVESRYRHSFDDAALRSALVEPFRAGEEFRLGLVDPDADAPLDTGASTAEPEAVLVVHGPFLHRPELRGVWDTTVWVDADAELRAAHIAKRLGPQPPEVVARAVDAERLYVREADPAARCDVVIDNTDPANPVREDAAFCTVEPLP